MFHVRARFTHNKLFAIQPLQPAVSLLTLIVLLLTVLWTLMLLPR